MFTKQKMTSAVVINQVALTEALNGMKHERCEKAIECHHPCHESSLGCAFIKSEFIMLIFYLTGSYPSETPSVGKKTDVTRANVEEARGGSRKQPDGNSERAGGKMPFPDVYVLRRPLEIKSEETLASEQDAKPKASGVCPRAGRRRDGARGSVGLGLSGVTGMKNLMQHPIFPSRGCGELEGNPNPLPFQARPRHPLLFVEASTDHINVTARHRCPRPLVGC